MFNDARRKQETSNRISTDNDPLFQYHRWKANLRVLEIEEVKSLPYAPMSHPFIERLNRIQPSRGGSTPVETSI